MYFNYTYNDTKKQLVVTDCKKTIANMGWVKLQGVSRPTHGCAKGYNIAPVIEKTINVRNKSAPGPVNFVEVDGREYRLLPRGLGRKVPYGPSLLK